MPKFAKVEKATTEILEIRELAADSVFATNKPVEWLPFVEDSTEPAFDPDTQRLEEETVVDPGVNVTRRFKVVALTAEEQAALKEAKITQLDTVMARAAEVLVGKLISKGVVQEADFPQDVIDALSARQNLRV